MTQQTAKHVSTHLPHTPFRETHLISKHGLNLLKRLILRLRVEEIKQNNEDKVADHEDEEVLPRDGLEGQWGDVDQGNDNGVECCVAACDDRGADAGWTDFGGVLLGF